MKTYLLSYDLRRPSQSYTQLIDELKRLGAVRVQQSVWVLRSSSSAMALHQHLCRHGIDGNDRLIVTAVDERNTALTVGTPWLRMAA